MSERSVREALDKCAARHLPADADLWPAIRRQVESRPYPSHSTWRAVCAGLVATRLRVALAAATVLLVLSAALTVPVVGLGRPFLPHVAPREIAPPTAGGAPILPAPPVTYLPAPTSVIGPLTSLAQVTEQAGFVPLVPAYLPAGCGERVDRRYVDVEHREVYLNYQRPGELACLWLTEWPVNSYRPAVGAGATEEVSVGGLPAIYIRGRWVDDSTGQAPPSPTAGRRRQQSAPAPVWREDRGHELVLERDGLIIQLVAQDRQAVPKEELIRIAESLVPAK